ncbi:MAG TPA: 50S ribosomal protein L24 [Thermoplasmata archaeon]|nr:50S ribosomal protein L24 [Thermoplasmata archaeon]
MTTTKARKQRKRLFNAPLHRRGKRIACHVDKTLREKNPGLPRAVPLRKGDQVKVFRGEFRGKTGKVTAVDHREFRVTVEDLTVAKADDKLVPRPIHASNLVIISFDETDARRRERLTAKGAEP